MRTLSLLVLATAFGCGTAERAPRPPPLDPSDWDRDGDPASTAGGSDCADADPGVRGGASELCDGIDQDCDGAIDENFECVAGAEVACEGGTRACSPQCRLGPCAPPGNCASDDGECLPGELQTCDIGCPGAWRTCTPGCTWGPCALPAELCNGFDDDCDGEVDEGLWGIASGLHELGMKMFNGGVAIAVVDGGSTVLVYGAGEEVLTAWAGADGAAIAEPGQLWDIPVDDLSASAAGQEVVITGTTPEAATIVSVVSLDRVRSEWTVEMRYTHTSAVWTGSELLLLDGPRLAAYDLDGSRLREVVTLPYDDVRAAVWTAGGLAVSVDGAVAWVSLEGLESRRVDVGTKAPPLLASRGGAVVAAGFEAPDRMVLTKLSPGGATTWSLTLATPDIFPLHSVWPVEGGWVVIATSFERVGGAWIDDAGSRGTPASWWTHLPGAMEISAAGDGSTTWIGTSDLSVARLGCRSEEEEGVR